ncbi:glycosyl transferase [Clostridium pasteurianum]|uniref:glycosyl transferase n=1 Tax=Clostridium pasteurianum TaxID=1501 RepID=UPI002260C7E5|nr:glycosyl transferase [Clostridium pasteurianum]UZW15057.1 glycosyl transferase [Clostridium pasteurianum]
MPRKRIIFNDEYLLECIESPHIKKKVKRKKVNKKPNQSPEINENKYGNVNEAKQADRPGESHVQEVPRIEAPKPENTPWTPPAEAQKPENTPWTPPAEASKPENTAWFPPVNYSVNSSCNFCTVAGKDYTFKVLALYKSLKNTSNNFNLWVCCMDPIACYILSKLNLYNLHVFRVEDLEDAALLSIKSSRKTNEYCWTLKAPLIRYVLDTYKVPDVIYCDSDLYFFSDPKAIYDEWGSNDVFLCLQRDLQWVEAMYGKYQAGLIGFKNTPNALSCLDYWRSKCIEWCSANPEPNMDRFGDQKYLDKVPEMYSGVKVSDNYGINAAPWNCVYNNDYNIYKKDDYVYIEKEKLVVFHFATIAIFNSDEFDLWSFNYIHIRRTIKDYIYIPYLSTIRECINRVKHFDNSVLDKLFATKPLSDAQTYYRYLPSEYRIKADDDTKYFCTLMSKDYLIKGLTFYRSLKTNGNNFHLWICCIDELIYSILKDMELENVTLVPLPKLEDEEIRRCKKTRTATELCWTLKAPLVEYVLDNYDVDYVIYCDADLFFFSNPSPIIKDWVGYYFYICTQRDNYDYERIHGRFQAGFIGFKKLKETRRILTWWKKKCIEWCFDNPQPEHERWGDQKYLDQVPLKFVGIKIENSLGINAAPWNVVYNNHYDVHNINGKVYIGNDMLVFYHFGSMHFYNENEYDLWKLKHLNFDQSVLDNIYIPYLKAVRDTINEYMPYIEDHWSELFADKEAKLPVNYINISNY